MHHNTPNNLDNLHNRQIEILNCIIDFSQKNKYPPTVREISTLVGLKSSSSVHSHLVKLEEYGYIKRIPTKPRALEVTNKYYLDSQIKKTNLYVKLKPSHDEPDLKLLFKQFREILNHFDV